MFSGDITYKGKPLFRGAIMNSGSAVPTDPVDSAKAQQVYDAVVQGVGCAGQADTLQCLRQADYEVSQLLVPHGTPVQSTASVSFFR